MTLKQRRAKLAYVDADLSQEQGAVLYGISRQAFSGRLKRAGVPTKPRQKKPRVRMRRLNDYRSNA